MGKTFKEDSPSVQSHLTIMQSVIQRMASNSTSCKTWCITLVSAILVVVADKTKPSYIWIAYLPTILFFLLDAYYLALENMFRTSYKKFVERLHQGLIVAEDLYTIVPTGNKFTNTLCSMFSFSIWSFYLVLATSVFVAKRILT